jgi:hypothetical protein
VRTLHGYNGYVPSEMNQMLGQSACSASSGKLQRCMAASLSWLQSDGILGIDLADRTDLAHCRYNECPCRGTLRQGRSSVTRTTRSQLLGQARQYCVVAGEDVGDLQEHGRRRLHEHRAGRVNGNGNILPPGSQRPQDGAIPSVSVPRLATASKTLGAYVQEQAVAARSSVSSRWRCALIRYSAFGSNFPARCVP